MTANSNSRHVELSWAGRVRTGNGQSFDYAKDFEVICRFKELLMREQIYKEITKKSGLLPELWEWSSDPADL